jgi:predicted N-acyltransferase
VDFGVQIVHSVDEIGEQGWNRLSGGKPFASYRWYRFGEAVLVDDRPIYVILSLDGEPVARATFWCKREEPIEIRSVILRHLLQVILRRWPLLVCRSPLAAASGLILPDDPRLREAALEVIVGFAQKQARRCKASLLAFDYLEPTGMEWSVWPDTFLPVTIPEPGTYLEVTWPDFEGYLAHLSRVRRKHYRQHCRRAAEMGVEIASHRVVTAVDEAMALIRNVGERYHTSPASWTKRVLEHAGMVDAAWLAARVEGRLVGCELLLGDNGTWFVTALGRDYDFPHVYFLLGYEDVRYAIERGIRVLRWGSGTYEVKRRLGFRLEDNNHLILAAGNPRLHAVVRGLAAALFA